MLGPAASTGLENVATLPHCLPELKAAKRAHEHTYGVKLARFARGEGVGRVVSQQWLTRLLFHSGSHDAAAASRALG